MELINWNEYEQGFALSFCLEQINRNLADEVEKLGYVLNFSAAFAVSEEERIAAAHRCKWNEHIWLTRTLYKLQDHPRLTLLNAMLERFSALLELEIPVQAYRTEKEMQIQLARKRWLIAREYAEAKLLAYKREKGEFYKQQPRVARAS